MYGIVLAGGYGTRLRPLTKVTNKHLLPVYNKPMIYYPIETLVKAGVENIIIVLGGESIGDVVKLLGDGSEFGAKFSYVHQKDAGGIAEAVNLALPLINDEYVAVILGDNIFDEDFGHVINTAIHNEYDCILFAKEVEYPERFGVISNDTGYIEEKPKEPKSNKAVTGLYIYRKPILKWLIDKVIREKGYSNRGELEITDVNNEFLKNCRTIVANVTGFWSDAGTFKSLLISTIFMGEKDESLLD